MLNLTWVSSSKVTRRELGHFIYCFVLTISTSLHKIEQCNCDGDKDDTLTPAMMRNYLVVYFLVTILSFLSVVWWKYVYILFQYLLGVYNILWKCLNGVKCIFLSCSGIILFLHILMIFMIGFWCRLIYCIRLFWDKLVFDMSAKLYDLLKSNLCFQHNLSSITF